MSDEQRSGQTDGDRTGDNAGQSGDGDSRTSDSDSRTDDNGRQISDSGGRTGDSDSRTGDNGRRTGDSGWRQAFAAPMSRPDSKPHHDRTGLIEHGTWPGPESGMPAEQASLWRRAVERLTHPRRSHDAGQGQTGESIAVIGLGRFGSQVAISLMRLGYEVLGIDSDPQLVRRWSDELTHVAEADSTDDLALRQLGVAELSRVVVGIGTHIEASVLTVVALSELGVPEIWAKAINTKHGKILSAVGARHVVYPESAMGTRVAHLLAGRMLDFIELDDGFALAKTRAPDEATGRSLAELGFRGRYDVMVIAVRQADGRISYASPETVITPACTLIVAGGTEQVQRFSAYT